MTEARREYELWLQSDVFDDATKQELKKLSEEEINDAFYKQLTFGTGGLRGIIGAGTNRMNVYTVGKATQGLANFILSRGGGSVVIAYDSRHMSQQFAQDCACILAANGVKAYLFESLRPTPELSFAVRYLKATAGIVITASHNPPQYNGYKVYWSDGGQIVPPYDKLIIDEVNAVEHYSCIKRISLQNAKASGLLQMVGKDIDDEYISAIKGLILNPQCIRQVAKDIKIVYTPLHGTGNLPVCRVLKELGFERVWVVPEQQQPDGDFPTVQYPNPEDERAFDLALKLARQVGADLVLATDPDADRLGVYAKAKDGTYMPFNGNMSGLLIAEYELSQRKKLGLLPKRKGDGAIVTTIVSSNMAQDIAKQYDLTLIETLTGFKYIGEQIKLFEEAKYANGGALDGGKYAYEYEFGFEESYGCLVGTHARDKDAVMAVTALAEAAAYYMCNGLTLCDQMENIYKKYGYYKEGLATLTLTGEQGAQQIATIIDGLRNNPPKCLGGIKVLAVRDYKKGVRRDICAGVEGKLTLPKSNVIYLELEGNCWCCIRPSGTEPKIKYYFGVKGESAIVASQMLEGLKKDILNR